MIDKAMFKQVQAFKRQGYSKSAIGRALELDPRTVAKYFGMEEEGYRAYRQEHLFRDKVFDKMRREILEVYEANGFRPLQVSSVYDCLEERIGILPANEQTLRNYIGYLIQDRRGFIWIAGPYGLARYDGNSFFFFRHREEDPGSLADDLLFNVFEDSRGDIWVTSDKGLDLLDRKKGTFLHFRHDPSDPRTLSSDRIRAICEDTTGALWIGTMDGGVNRMDPATRQFNRYLHDPADPNSPGSDAVWTLCSAGNGKIWMGATGAGLDCYDPERGSWSHYPYQEGDPDGLDDLHYWALREGRVGRIWIGSNGGGLFWLEPSRGRFFRLHLRDEEARWRDHRILSLHEDRDGIVWIGTENAGLYRLDPETPVLSRATADPNRAGGLSDNSVLSIIEDQEGLLWFGTAKGGLSSRERKTGTWTSKTLSPGFLEEMTKVRIQAISEDDRSDLWFGTSAGIYRYFRRTGAFARYVNSALDPSILPNNSITVLLEGKPGFLWAGTKEGGFFAWDINAKKVRLFSEVMEGRLSASQINVMFIDRRGEVWVGTQWDGIVRFDPRTLRWSEYKHRPGDTVSLASPTVYAIAEDGRGRIWAGTQAGPCLFDAERDDWIRLADDFGLPDRPVYAIVPDEIGNLWMSSGEDLIKIQGGSRLMRLYTPEDGLQGGRFSYGAGFRCKNGEIVFGGAAGINYFLPREITDSPFLPPVAVTSVDLSSPAETISLFNAPEELAIPRSRFPLTVHVSALSFSHP